MCSSIRARSADPRCRSARARLQVAQLKATLELPSSLGPDSKSPCSRSTVKVLYADCGGASSEVPGATTCRRGSGRLHGFQAGGFSTLGVRGPPLTSPRSSPLKVKERRLVRLRGSSSSDVREAREARASPASNSSAADRDIGGASTSPRGKVFLETLGVFGDDMSGSLSLLPSSGGLLPPRLHAGEPNRC